MSSILTLTFTQGEGKWNSVNSGRETTSGGHIKRERWALLNKRHLSVTLSISSHMNLDITSKDEKGPEHSVR